MRAILAPLQEELKTIRTYLEIDRTIYQRPGVFWLGRIGAQEVLLGRTGIGIAAMRNAMEFCCRELRPSAVLLLGFAGATTPDAQYGQLVIGTEIIDATDGTRCTAPDGPADRARTICRETGLAAHVGRLVTQEEIMALPHEKAFLGTKYEAIAVDMESSAFAAVATACSIPWVVVRAVLDPMEMAIPDVVSQMTTEGRVAWRAVAGGILRAPRVLASLPRLYFASAKAREALTTFAKAWIVAGD